MSGNVERVLRAMDVIPPFGGDRAADDREDASTCHQGRAPRIRPWKRSEPDLDDPNQANPAGTAHEAGEPIPTLDLGEKILAEQRRMTARKRKAPGVAASEESSPSRPPVVPMRAERAVEPLARDVVELQQIVAEIVARDIERLCTGPMRTAS